jgi:L-ascorbate metabolism protein UlaG (beta-lactamase superfamily)
MCTGKSMKIRWHGHACFEVANGETVVTDPHDGKSIGLPTPRVKADIVLVSHNHSDHNSVRTVKGSSSRVYEKPGKFTDGRLEFNGIQSFHDDVGGQKRGTVVIFKWAAEGIRLCHLGDLGCLLSERELAEIGEVDILFVPVGDVFTLDAARAWQVIRELNPLVAVPMHYRVGGLSFSIKTLDPFLSEARGKADVVNVGNEIEFERADLPEKLTAWVFSL